MLRDISFFISEALIGMRRSGIMILISIATITVSLIILGFFLLISANMNNLANFISSKLEIRVYLKQNLAKEEIATLQQRISNMTDVRDVEFIDKTTAWQQFQQNFKSMDVSDLVQDNPLPDSFRVYLSKNDQIASLAQYLRTFPQVEDVGYMSTLAQRIELFAKFTRIAGFALVCLLSAATLLITINTIRLTVIARQNEITIMHLVGATHAFIRWPFIIEGILMGLTGSIFAVVTLKGSYLFFAIRFQETIPYFPLVFDPLTLNVIYGFVALMGLILGISGAYISVSKSLKASM
jgi:cell division transport system permease protein